MIFPRESTKGAITGILLAPANPTLLSNSRSYYLAGKQYIFSVNVIDPAATGWASISDLRLTIPNSTNILVAVNPGGLGIQTITASTGTVDAVVNITSGTYNNFTAEFGITIRWDTEESSWTPSRSITAQATSSNTLSNTKFVSYGVCSSMKVYSFAMTGEAADGKVNPLHEGFNVTGNIVYNVPGATAADEVDNHADAGAGEITAFSVIFNPGTDNASVCAGDIDESDGVACQVAGSFVAGLGTPLGTHTLILRATTATAPGTEDTANSLSLSSDRIQITNIRFINGGGVDTPYYRSVNIPGTVIEVTAQMENAGTAMVGDTTIIVRYMPDALPISFTINGGSNTGTAVVPNPAVTAGSTEPITYYVYNVYGGDYCSANGFGQYADDQARITQPANPVIYWDSNDPPGDTTNAFTDWVGISQLAYSITLNWTPLTSAGPDYDGDFSSYRIYYKKSTDTPWLMIDKTTTGYASLGLINTGTVTIQNLLPLTNYYYYITAVDVFGQESAWNISTGGNQLYDNAPNETSPGSGNYYGSTNTAATSVMAEITDGITIYTDDSFSNDKNASARPLRKTAIKISMYIITSSEQPDAVSIIAAPDTISPIVTGGVLNGTEGIDYYRITCSRTGPNKWSGYIPDTSPLIGTGLSVKFIMETLKSGTYTYVDHDSEDESPPGNPNDYEWRFSISTPANFKPWPVRILNNVITKRNPYAYPSYYLTDDAFVTIKVYDIKGRPVITLLDKSLRRGGQNIKEKGWNGYNKARRKLGAGLYYIHIKAQRASDGRVILNKFKKVVMAK